jgi:hypothetical protein
MVPRIQYKTEREKSIKRLVARWKLRHEPAEKERLLILKNQKFITKSSELRIP